MVKLASNSTMHRIASLAGMLLLAAAIAVPRDHRPNLFPKLQSGQVLTYSVRFQSGKNVKTESSLAVSIAPPPSQVDARLLLRIDILEVQQIKGKPSVHARSQFLKLDSDARPANPRDSKSNSPPRHLEPDGNPVEFTISPNGDAENVTGLDALAPEQLQAWQEWLARFAVAWTLPASRLKIGDKWKAEQPEQAASPIAALLWARDSAYVRNEPCLAPQLSSTGEIVPSDGPRDTCAVLYTTAKLVQKSSPKDATPEDFKLHELKTAGTAKGTNEIIAYISLSTGLLVRATEEAHQQMDVAVAKSDGSNRVRYNVDASSHAEVLLLTQAQAPSRH